MLIYFLFLVLGKKERVEELLNAVGGFRVERVAGKDNKVDLSIEIVGSEIVAMIDVKNYDTEKTTSEVLNSNFLITF